MSLAAIRTKRLRRTWEPEEKTWNDEMLEQPWEDVQPPLHKSTLFALKNVFFFSHSTPVQAATIGHLRQQGHSAIVEAPTGSGKTLGFLVPLMERTVRFCDDYVQKHARPPLCKHILGVILSPSRTLAEQTYVVAKNLSSRYPYNIQFSLCDGVLERPASVVEKLRRAQRGAGTFIVSTPKDFEEFLRCLGNETTNARTATPRRDEREDPMAPPVSARIPTTSDVNVPGVTFFASDAHRFVVVIDEADLVFYSPEMRGMVSGFIDLYAAQVPGATAESEVVEKQKSKLKKRGTKAVRQEKAAPTEATTDASGKLPMDFAFVGATVATSAPLRDFAAKCGRECGTALQTVALRSNDDFVSQLQNKYIVCDAHNFLPVFVQLMNVHASRKHFVFFNSFRTLLFVQKLFSHLCQGPRPLLYIKDIFVMYEGMSENARIEQYNQFLTHTSTVAAGKRGEAGSKAKSFSEEKKNQVFAGGCKREGKPSMGTGAILLCTDIAAFGLDVRDVDYVYHFEPPSTVQSYIHRVGRVGRMGMKGSSILLLPCIAVPPSDMANAKERKGLSDGGRFHTLTNTKSVTGELQTVRTSLSSLPAEWQEYVRELSAHNALEEYALPPFAPLTATLRNMVTQDAKVLKLAKNAAIAMCHPPQKREGEASGDAGDDTWFFPKLALMSLLLD